MNYFHVGRVGTLQLLKCFNAFNVGIRGERVPLFNSSINTNIPAIFWHCLQTYFVSLDKRLPKCYYVVSTKTVLTNISILVSCKCTAVPIGCKCKGAFNMCKKTYLSPITVYLARECEKLRERSKSDRNFLLVALDLMNASISRFSMRGF